MPVDDGSRLTRALAELTEHALEFAGLALVSELARFRGERVARRVVEEHDDASQRVRVLDLVEGLFELRNLIDAAGAEATASGIEREDLRAAERALVRFFRP